MLTITSKKAHDMIQNVIRSDKASKSSEATSTLNWDLVLELSEQVWDHTVKEANSRGEWMNQWLMAQKMVALNTMYKKARQKAKHVQNSNRTREAAGIHAGEQETSHLEQRCRGERHDSQGKRSQKCHGEICDPSKHNEGDKAKKCEFNRG